MPTLRPGSRPRRRCRRPKAGWTTSPRFWAPATIQALRAEQAKVERSLSELQDTGTLKSSQLPSLQSQLDSLKQQIAVEVQRVLKSLDNELDVARRKESAAAGRV